MENRIVLGLQVFPLVNNIAVTFTHTEPTLLTTLQEAQVPNALLESPERATRASNGVLQAVPNAIGVYCLKPITILWAPTSSPNTLPSPRPLTTRHPLPAPGAPPAAAIDATRFSYSDPQGRKPRSSAPDARVRELRHELQLQEPRHELQDFRRVQADGRVRVASGPSVDLQPTA